MNAINIIFAVPTSKRDNNSLYNSDFVDKMFGAENEVKTVIQYV